MPAREDEPRRRRRDYDSNRDSSKYKDKDRYKSSRTSRSSLTRRTSPTESERRDREAGRPRDGEVNPGSPGLTRSYTSTSHTKERREPMGLVPEMERRASTSSPAASKTSLAYPSFSKAHSKEAVHQKVEVYTPDPTDIGRDGHSRKTTNGGGTATRNAPPSPPLTNLGPELDRAGSGRSVRRGAEKEGADFRRRKVAFDPSQGHDDDRDLRKSASTPRRRTSRDHRFEETSPSRASKSASTSPSRNRTSKAPDRPASHDARPSTRSASGSSSQPSTVIRSVADSDITSIAPNQAQTRQVNVNPSGTPTRQQSGSLPQHLPPKSMSVPLPESAARRNSPVEIFFDAAPLIHPAPYSSTPAGASAPQPPPPPPIMEPPEVPRVDYLLQNGGLPRLVSRSLLRPQSVGSVPTYHQYASPPLNGSPANEVNRLFVPLQSLLDDYTQVMSKNGSIAVATGYRSVARRLLDRLEAVFARNISSQTCRCIMCQSSPNAVSSEDEDTGLSWGEILELVSARKELPAWPPFSITADSKGLNISGAESMPPMQKLDIDVPEELRDHYVRQSQKTKVAVQSWLASQPEFPSSPPQEVDDETLTFAMLTHIEVDQQKMFAALLRGTSSLPSSRAPTPLEKPKSDLISKSALALQRLYRLSNSPRQPECAIYLLKNPALHNVLATLAAISGGEWEILTSGRFDGFLWSGAETTHPQASTASAFTSPAASRGPSRGPTATPLSRTTTPFSDGNPAPPYYRGTTPFSPGHPHSPSTAQSQAPGPVQLDEETEIAVLAEVEREIYLGMEALEDAFEALHLKAEAVRRLLRERGAGLAVAGQARRGSSAEGVEVRMGTPASGAGLMGNGNGNGNGNGWHAGEAWDGASVTDDGMDERSELAPDDSASNVSWRRRPRRRHERRTPAPVEEEGSEYGGR